MDGVHQPVILKLVGGRRFPQRYINVSSAAMTHVTPHMLPNRRQGFRLSESSLSFGWMLGTWYKGYSLYWGIAGSMYVVRYFQMDLGFKKSNNVPTDRIKSRGAFFGAYANFCIHFLAILIFNSGYMYYVRANCKLLSAYTSYAWVPITARQRKKTWHLTLWHFVILVFRHSQETKIPIPAF